MFLVHFITALLIAVILGLIVKALGWRGPWEPIWMFLIVLFLFIWLGGAWATPYGPPLLGVYWGGCRFCSSAFSWFFYLPQSTRPLDLRQCERR